MSGRVGALLVALLVGGIPARGVMCQSASRSEAPGKLWEEMKRAADASDGVRLAELIDRAAGSGTAEACRAIIHSALRGNDRSMEVRAFNLLRQIEDPGRRAVIYEEAVRNPNFKTRIVLLGVAFQQRDDPRAFAVLAQAIQDLSPPVALTALRWLRESNDADRAVPVLIRALEIGQRKPAGRYFQDARKALQALTGASLHDAADWRTYWDGPRGEGPPSPQRSPTRAVGFFSVPIQSDRVLFIIDVSRSMEKRDPPLDREGPITVVRNSKTKAVPGKAAPGEGLEDQELPIERQRLYRVKEELIRTIRSLPQDVQFTVLAFSSAQTFLDDSPRLIFASPENKARTVLWVRGLMPEGETWTDSAFERALTEVMGVDTIYLLSDGLPYRNFNAIPPGEVLEQVKVLNRFVKCRIHTIGFLQAGNNLQAFLKRMALEHDGSYTALR